MALLANADRLGVWARLMQDLSAAREQVPSLTKADLRAAVDAVDQWVDDNAASYNSAIPQPVRGALTARQKAELLLYVIRQRYEVA